MFDDKIITLQNLTTFKDKMDDQFAKKVDLSFTFAEAFGVSVLINNGHVAAGEDIPPFVEEGMEYIINFEADAGYTVPATDAGISVIGATYTYNRTSDTVGQLVFVSEGDVAIEITCEQGTPSTLIAIAEGQDIDGIVVDPNGMSFEALNAYINDILDEAGKSALTLLDTGTDAGILARREGSLVTLGISGGEDYSTLVYASDAVQSTPITEAGWWFMGYETTKVTDVTVFSFGVTKTITSSMISEYFTDEVNGVVFGAHLVGGNMKRFTSGMTITGMEVDPNGTPDGYASIDEWLSSLDAQEVQEGLELLDFNNGGSDDFGGVEVYLAGNQAGEEVVRLLSISGIDGTTEQGGYVVYAPEDAYHRGELIYEKGWTIMDAEGSELPLTEKVTFTISTPVTNTTFNNAVEPINGTIIGAIEGEGPTGLTPFVKGQNINDGDYAVFDTTISNEDLLAFCQDVEQNGIAMDAGGGVIYYPLVHVESTPVTPEYISLTVMKYNTLYVLSANAFDGAVEGPCGWFSEAFQEWGVTEAGWFNMIDGNKLRSHGTWNDNQYLYNNGEGWNGIIVGYEAGSQPAGLTEFEVGQTISGVVIDPNARPTGYEDTTLYPTALDAMVAWARDHQPTQVGEGEGLVKYPDPQIAEAYGFVIEYVVQEGVYVINIHDAADGYYYGWYSQSVMGSPAGWFVADISQGTPVFTPITERTTVQLAAQADDIVVDSKFAALNGTVLGAVTGTPPTPAGLTPFVVGDTVYGLDFGDVQNGATSNAMDSFLSNLAYAKGDNQPIMVVNHEGNEYIYIEAVRDSQKGIYMLNNYYEPTDLTKFTTLYYTDSGFQQLFDGKYYAASDISVSDISLYVDPTLWNGVLVGNIS